MVQPRGHDAVSPQPLGAQFVQLAAGGDGVAAGHHPVISGRGDDDADPTHEARDEAHYLQARGHHCGRHPGVPGPRPALAVPAPGTGRRLPRSSSLPRSRAADRRRPDVARWRRRQARERLRAQLRRHDKRTAGTAARLGSAPLPPLFKPRGPGGRAPIGDGPGEPANRGAGPGVGGGGAGLGRGRCDLGAQPRIPRSRLESKISCSRSKKWRVSGASSVLLQIISHLAARLTSLSLGLFAPTLLLLPIRSFFPAESRDRRPPKGARYSSSTAQDSNNG